MHAARACDAAHSAYLDLAPFEAYRAEVVRSMRAPRTVPSLTIERIMAGDPDMPRSVAEYQLQRMRRAMSENDDFRLGPPARVARRTDPRPPDDAGRDRGETAVNVHGMSRRDVSCIRPRMDADGRGWTRMDGRSGRQRGGMLARRSLRSPRHPETR